MHNCSTCTHSRLDAPDKGNLTAPRALRCYEGPPAMTILPILGPGGQIVGVNELSRPTLVQPLTYCSRWRGKFEIPATSLPAPTV